MEGIGNEIQERIKKKGLIINRIPEFAKEAFLERAKFEFENDYGMCLSAIIKESNEYLLLKQMFLSGNLNVKLLFENNNINSNEENVIKTGSGKIIRKGRVN